jgi:radical SAM protein with 4Fe4S-binding SPASM domain
MLLVSLDTVDPELMSQLRRGARLEQIYENIIAVQQYAAARRRRLEIAISFTVGDLSIPGVVDTVRAMLERGVTTFRFGDLAEYAPIEDTLRMRHISTMPAEELHSASVRFREAVAMIEQAGGSAQVDPTLAVILLRESSLVEAEERETKMGEKTVRHDDVKRSETRDCLDPWRLAFVQADASVRPCCFFEEKLGTVATDSLERVTEGESFRKLRRELLTGELRPNCASCNARPIIDRALFEEKVKQYTGA